MQIAGLDHLQFPAMAWPAPQGDVAGDRTDLLQAGATRAGVPKPSVSPQADLARSGLIAPDTVTLSQGAKEDVVYRRPGADRRAVATDRASAAVHIGLDQDGSLVAKAAAPGLPVPRDFVAFAVTALREYAKEQEHYKATLQTVQDPPDARPAAQKLLARLNPFQFRS
jgi:hypothetical protein